jgi:hypothetical protein
MDKPLTRIEYSEARENLNRCVKTLEDKLAQQNK